MMTYLINYKAMKKTILLICSVISFTLHGQNVGVNSTGNLPDASAMLDVSSTNSGLLMPRMLSSQRTSITTPATGLIVYQTDAPAGFYYYDGVLWQMLSGGGKQLMWHSSLSSANAVTSFAGAQTLVYHCPAGAFTSANEALTQMKMPKCLVTRMRIIINNNTLNTATTVTLRKNGVNTTLTLVIPALSITTVQVSGAISFADGDLLSVSAVYGGTALQSMGILGVELTYY